MATQLVLPIALVALVVVGYLLLDSWTRRTAHLNLGLFRPYRRDPWPVGVQEDDDFRFHWTPTPAPAVDRRESAGTAMSLPERAATIEDVAAAPGPLTRVRARTGSAGDAFADRTG